MRTLAVALLLIGLLGLGLSSYLAQSYETLRPTVPDANAGYIYELHPIRGGRTVYVSKTDYWMYFGSEGGIILAAIGGFLFERVMRRTNRAV